MKKEQLKEIISQLKHYELIDEFKNEEELISWITKLSKDQINNFLNISVPITEIRKYKSLIIDTELLKCNDIGNRIKTLSKIQIFEEDTLDLLESLKKSKFLISDNFYDDIHKIKNKNINKYFLTLFGSETFIKSKYHSEDLDFIIEANEEEKESKDLILKYLVDLAINPNSINSKFHRKDMKIIKNLAEKESLEKGLLYKLAINKNSLKDEHHDENMILLSKDSVISQEFLFELMTSSSYIRGKNYLQEIYALASAKNKENARALYYYIVNPLNKFEKDSNFKYERKEKETDLFFSTTFGDNYIRKAFEPGKEDKDYQKNLEELKEANPDKVMEYVCLLMTIYFKQSKFKQLDLSLLKDIEKTDNFYGLWKVLSNPYFILSPHHVIDAYTIAYSNIKNRTIYDFLLYTASDRMNIKSKTHLKDMQFIKGLNIPADTIIEPEVVEQMKYYLLNKNGIEDPMHGEKLNDLYYKITGITKDNSSNYLDKLEDMIASSDDEIDLSKIIDNKKKKTKSKIK